ncbi:hypothetical protein [Pelagibius marinus]|uniref:hypothetical protein n=1 Tax=Pelagibius marinus TaxID=2762760 RepID=UPI0018729DC4|nr:hypothetical protein [Pelagibius marinus]
MSQLSDTSADTAGRQTVQRLQAAERLPVLLYLWLPLVIAGVLSFTWHLNPDFYRSYVVGEIGLLEATHVIVPIISVIVALRILLLAEVRRDRLVFVWILLGLLGSVYMAGEEASWGQHYAGWLTPESWQAINDQGETNLHNTSSWLDQKPRTLLEIGVIVGGIIIPLLALRRPAIRAGRFAVFLPPLVCLPVALIGETAKFSERLQSKGLWDPVIFYQASEVQELYLSLFILFYLIVFRNRLLARRKAGLPARSQAAGR